MLVSTKGRYGLRVLIDIALHQGSGVVALRDIAKRQAISQKYLWQIINPLKAAGLLRAARGASGGYALSRDPAEISVRDLVAVLEGDVSVVGCVTAPETCERSVGCTAREAWQEIETKLNAAMRSITLKALVARQREKESRATASYDI
jgi:Rrf2 family protein